MSLKIVDCEEPTIVSFFNNIKKEEPITKHTSIEESKARRPNSLVLGKIVKVISFSTEAERFVLLVKECLPGYEYSEKFKAVIEGCLARELEQFSPQTGDRLAFLEPFIFTNPAFESEKCIQKKKQPKNLLYCSIHGEGTLMWFAKKREMGGKSDDEKRVKQARSPEKSLLHNATPTSGQSPGRSSPGKSALPNDGKTRSKSADVKQTLDSVRKKPLIQLPQKPQIPFNTKRLNPHYTYKSIKSIISSDITRNIEQSVNIFGVVHEIIKPISTTKKNKFMMVCILIDDSDKDNAMLKFHFFVPEDTIIKQIEVGDIVRLHRVKLETFNDQIDGRVFFSQDVVVFKKDYPNTTPITTAKNTLITDDEKRRVETLKKWYSEHLRKPTLLSDIYHGGKYSIFCKVIREPKKEMDTVKVRVTDGSVVKSLIPSMPLQRYKRGNKVDHIVTELFVHNKLEEYARLKLNDFVLFCDVEAIPLGDEMFRLEINSEISPEISVEKSILSEDIECRIEQFTKSMNNNDQNKDKNGLNNSNALEIVETTQNMVPTSTGQENETSVQTRQQKSKQKTSPLKNVESTGSSSCDNKSGAKPNTKADCDGKNTESDSGTKSRKQLFTPNYMTDLSDAATDETSEHNLEISKHLVNKVPDEDVVNPANTNFNDIVEKVKTKYCTPKRQEHQSMSQDDEGVVQRCSSTKLQEGGKFPVIMLEKLSVSEGNSSCREDTNRKRVFNISESQEDIEDAETIINKSQQTGIHARLRQGNKRTRLESLSTAEGNLRTNDTDVDHELEKRAQKVSSWLFHPNNRIVSSQQEVIADDGFDVAVIKQILFSGNDSPDMSKYISAVCFRIQAFLLDVVPDPSTNPFDLVSGYCHSGCQGIYLYSTIKWQNEENVSLPLCPECFTIEQEKELQLMLMMQLIIMDSNGRHGEVLVCRNHAEQFLSCSVTEFVKDEKVRKSRVQLLVDYTVQNTYRSVTTPLLDIGVSPLNSTSPTYVLVNSTLKLPRI